MRGLITAIRTLSSLPVPGREADAPADAIPWFPLVGALLGAILYGLAHAGCRLIPHPWPAGIAVLVVLAGVLLTRALHLDGLADWADGFWGATDPARVLAIMKDSRIGVFGAAALTLCLLAKWVALTRLLTFEAYAWLIPALVLSRTVQADLAVTLPYARAEQGTAAPFVRHATPRHRQFALLCGATLLFLFQGQIGLGLFIAGWLGGRLLGRWFKARTGGVTGDLLGAAGELTETTVLLAAGLLAPCLPVPSLWALCW